jgi:glycosyltransferase involved in cell wall biosynthesis
MISIIIPVFNEEKIIEATIRQFMDLRIPHEVIVSDTQSTDRTIVIAKRAAHKVLLLPPQALPGVGRGRNHGAAAAAGEFLVFLDTGTMIPDPNYFFGKLLTRFEKDRKLVGLSVRIEVDPKAATASDVAVSWLMNAYFAAVNYLFNLGLASGKFQIIKKEAFQKAGGFNESLATAEDIDLFGRLSQQGRVRTEWGLAVYHSGRRFHALGAWSTLFHWIKNAFYFWIFRKGSSAGWRPIR